MLSAPKFWQKPQHIFGRMLSPLGAAYGSIVEARMRSAVPKKMEVPIVCVGNLVLGGAGKTPVAIALGKLLQSMGKNIHYLSRGYLGVEPGPARVRKEKYTFHEVGDEPFLLAEHATTWVSKVRSHGALRAIERGAEVIVMDDGHQNFELHKDLSFVVVEGSNGFGNSKVFPAGPLRENIEQGLNRADAMIVIGECKQGIIKQYSETLPVFQATILPNQEELLALRGRKLMAFAGIGNPHKFFDFLVANGLEVRRQVAFPDHHPYKNKEMRKLINEAREGGLQLVTTAKDAIKIPEEYQADVKVLNITAQFDDVGRLKQLIEERCWGRQ